MGKTVQTTASSPADQCTAHQRVVIAAQVVKNLRIGVMPNVKLPLCLVSLTCRILRRRCFPVVTDHAGKICTDANDASSCVFEFLF